MTDADPTWEKYFRSAAVLKESIERNLGDTEFALDHQIIYIFDANIFVFDADINDQHRLTEHVDNLVGTGPRQQEITKTFERFTASFLFSGRLPGQEGGKSYITLPHLAEALDVSRAIALNIDKTTKTQPSPLLKAEIREEVAAIVDGRGSTAQKLRELGKALPATWLRTLDAKAHFSRALREAFVSPQCLVPLDKVKWGRKASQLRHDDVQPWLNILSDIKPARTLEHIRADALSLATITNLYRDDPTSRFAGREKLYLFVTTDRALAAAVRKRLPILKAQGIPNFVRLPEDYLPLLNLNTMSMALSQAPADHKLQQAFSNVFTSLRLAVDWIALVKRDVGARYASFPLNKDPLANLQETWRTIADYVAVLNLPYMRDAAFLFQDLRNYLTPERRVVAAEAVENSVLEVSDQHLLIVLEATLTELKQDERTQPRARRIHLQVLGDMFSDLVPGGDLNHYLDVAIGEGALTDDVRTSIEHRKEHPEVQLLAACLFIAGDRWSLATQAASRGLKSLETSGPNSSNRYDARYLVAHCLRFSMRRESELLRAKHLLELNLQAYLANEDTTELATQRRLRDEIEYGSLLITAAILEALAPTSAGRRILGPDTGWHLFPSVSGSEHGYLVDGVKHLTAALDELHRSNSANDEQSFFSGLIRQATTNLVEAYIFETIGPGLQGDQPILDKEIHSLMEALSGFIEPEDADLRPLLLTHHIYYWRARCLTAGSEGERLEHLEKLRTFLVDSRGNYKLPLIDMIEFQFIDDQLAIPASQQSEHIEPIPDGD